MAKSSRTKSLITLHWIILLLGFTGILGKLITIGSTLLVWWRMGIAFVALALYLAFRKELNDIPKKLIGKLIGTGAIVAIHWILFFESIKVSNISVAVVCLSTASLMSAFLEPFFFKRKTRGYEVIFGLIVIFGLSLAFDAGTQYKWGYIYGILSAFFASLFTNINGLYVDKISSSKLSMLEMIGGFITISLYLPFMGDIGWESFTLSSSDFFYIMLLAIVCTAYAFVESVRVMEQLTPFTVTVSFNLEPIYSIIFALLIFKESEEMDIQFYIGVLCIISVVLLDGYFKSSKAREKLKSITKRKSNPNSPE
jgi:drug/metabolite transporter (DMT)-like permease